MNNFPEQNTKRYSLEEIQQRVMKCYGDYWHVTDESQIVGDTLALFVWREAHDAYMDYRDTEQVSPFLPFPWNSDLRDLGLPADRLSEMLNELDMYIEDAIGDLETVRDGLYAWMKELKDDDIS